MISPQNIRFAIVGCGSIAARHAAQISRVGKLMAVCDIIQEKANNLAIQYQTKHYYSLQDLLQDEKESIDVVAICTPNGLHAEQSIAAMQNGWHVLCEKPLAIDPAAANEMTAVASATHKKLFVVKSTRFNRSVLALKAALENGQLGKVYSFQLNCFWNRSEAYFKKDPWRGSLQLDGGVLYTQFSHYIDVLSWLFGSIKSASGYRQNLTHKNIIEFEDTGTASIVMHNDILGGINWSINAYEKNVEVSLTVFAEKGTIKIGGTYMNEIEYQLPQNVLVLSSDKDNPANDYGFYKGSMSNHDKVYDNLRATLENNVANIATGQDGLETVTFIDTIYKSCPLIV